MVIVISLAYFCAIGLSVTVFSLDSYSRTYWWNRIISGSIIFLIIFFFLLMLYGVHHHCLLIGILFIIGMIHLVGQ